ncbi:MAG: S-layer homology domain-containing protein, partial [Clostridia bacterium]|nr:S-layer homology domain-containing protein [Clostridia bacterium]
MKNVKYLWKVSLCFFFLFSFCFSPVVVNAKAVSGVTDIQDHWAVKQINDWTNKGLVGGYPDGTFKPNNQITRAEFIALVNRAFGYKEVVSFGFFDVSENDWFATEIAKAQAIGYIGGYPDGTVKPNSPISRQEVAAILAKILKPKATQFNLALKFTDSVAIPEWSVLAVNAIVNNGYMGGYPDNTFKPAQPITRAESISVLARAVGALYHQAGIYDSTETLTGNVTISSSDIILKNAVITGDLYLTEGIDTGNVTLDNVQVQGTTKVRGGGENSIIIKDSNLGSVLVNVSHKVRLLAQGTSTIGTVEARTGTKLEEQNLTGSGFENVIIAAPRNAKIELIGNFENIDVETPQTKIDLLQGTIKKITLAPATQGTGINLAPETTVYTFTTYSVVTVTGEGAIRIANINVNGVELATEPTLTLAIAEGVEALVAGKSR